MGSIVARGRPSLRGSIVAWFGVLACTVALTMLVVATPALAAGSPWWQATSSVRPSTLAPGGEGTITLKALNLGDGATSGAVTLRDALPAGVSVLEEEHEGEQVPRVRFLAFSLQQGQLDIGPGGPLAFIPELHELCKVTGNKVTGQSVVCTTPPEFIPPLGMRPVAPFEDLEMQIAVKLEGAASGDLNSGEVSGGEAATATTTRRLEVSNAAPSFGVEELSLVPEEEGGSVDAQAGSHPFQLTTTFALNQTADPAKPPALARNLQFKLPAGLVGNTTTLPQCSDLDFRDLINNTGTANRCPADTVVGVASLTVDEPAVLKLTTLPVPLFNLVPGKGEPARFGFEFAGTPVTLDTSVRTGKDYGVTVSVSNITQLTSFLSSTVTFWGVPGDLRHDESRGWGCLATHHWGEAAGLPCEHPNETSPPPFLTLPTSCAGRFATTVEGESWPLKASPSAEPRPDLLPPREYALEDRFGRALTITGCNELPFAPSLEVAPDIQSSSTPTGLTVHVRVPQEVNQNPGGLASSAVKDITVALPEGVAINPAGGDGLDACSESEIGFLGMDEPSNTALFSAVLSQPFCPNAAKIGTVDIASPLLPPTQHLKGSVFLASQNENPFGSLVAMYIVAEDPISGVLVKLSGEVHLTPSGQLVSVIKNSPELPFEDAELHFFGGERAPLATPAHCGDYTTVGSFVPWAAESSDLDAATQSASSTFNITSGPSGGPCPPSALPFAPSLSGGMTSLNAGSFSPLTTTISRTDGSQNMQSVQLHIPPGVEGLLTAVKLCPEQQANEGTCGPDSLIGETTVSAGVGSDPVTVTGGKVYLTEKYAGAPFGLSIVNPVKAGPFDLEHDTANPNNQPPCDCLVVRARIEVDPLTADLTVTTDPSGPHAIPRIIDGIPVQIQRVNVTVNRSGFTFNPTNCSPSSIDGTIAGDEGTTQPVSFPFQAVNCSLLKFSPKVDVSTAAQSSKAHGADLVFTVSYPAGAMGRQAWFKEARFSFPKQLPARLTTLQKACLASAFESNPANCPAASLIGHATVRTPVLPVPLSGPVYFVSYGNTKFPDAVIVLQGYGITVNLRGHTSIDGKTGITTATFADTPDVPFERLEVTIPSGPFSEFAANLPAKAKGSFCGQKLIMPTKFVAQNGLEINQNTKIAVRGCKAKRTRAARLAAALRACKKKPKSKRAACRAQARRRYGVRGKQKR